MPGKLKSLARYKFLNSMYACNSHAFTPVLIFGDFFHNICLTKACLVWSSAMFKGKKENRGTGALAGGKVNLLCALSASSQNFKKVSCWLAVTLWHYADIGTRGGREEGREEAEIETEQEGWKEMLTKRSKYIYSRILQHLPRSPVFFHPLTVLKSFPVNTSIFCSWKPP